MWYTFNRGVLSFWETCLANEGRDVVDNKRIEKTTSF